MRYITLTLFFFISICNLAIAQSSDDKTLFSKPWNACWIGPSKNSGREYGIYYFSKSLNLTEKPGSFRVKVSADNRYKLYVNGALVSVGPARGDTYYWNYELINLSPYLKLGKNDVTAIVWNNAEFRPEAQISLQTAFILQGNSPNEEILNSDSTWKCVKNQAYTALTGIGYSAWYIADPGELVDMNQFVKVWKGADFNNEDWPNARRIDRGYLKGSSDASGWMLVPSEIPQMERTVQRIPLVRKTTGITTPASFPSVKVAITIPANTTASFLLDQTYLTNAYLTLNFSKGKGAGISLTYAETLFDNLAKYGTKKGNRNDVEGKDFAGRRDSIISNGFSGQSFNTLYWRTFRYIRLRVQTKDEPLIIDDIYGTFTGYPFQSNAKIKTNNPEIQSILNIGWRTARLDAMETYMDCPYYEQLQYIGDTRIQALVSYFDSGDDRLARNAINLIDHSRISEGLTFSRYPSRSSQIIPTFSLCYISMLHDFWIYRPDNIFIKNKLQGERSVLDFFNKYQQFDGSLKGTPYWNFVDWAKGKNWNRGVPPKGENGESAILDLQLLLAYQMAAEMESKIGIPAYAKLYYDKMAQLKHTIRNKYWDSSRQLYADAEDKNLFSQHTNSLAILAGLGKPAEQMALARKILSDTTLTACTIYFKYYMHQALIKAGLGNDYMKWLGVWRENIANGLTTWAETSDLTHTRSDCHAWGASPNIEFYRTILGIDSYGPGFSKVKIEPHFGNELGHNISGEIPHPNGKISVQYVDQNKYQDIVIVLPQKISGIFIWKGRTYRLLPGRNKFRDVNNAIRRYKNDIG